MAVGTPSTSRRVNGEVGVVTRHGRHRAVVAVFDVQTLRVNAGRDGEVRVRVQHDVAYTRESLPDRNYVVGVLLDCADWWPMTG